MTTPEIVMYAATALNIGCCISAIWYAEKVNKGSMEFIDQSEEIVDDLLHKNVDLMVEKMHLISERNELRDAAEFEARVVERLTNQRWRLGTCSSECPWSKMDPKDSFSCIYESKGNGFCALRAARCKVEEEMDNAD